MSADARALAALAHRLNPPLAALLASPFCSSDSDESRKEMENLMSVVEELAARAEKLLKQTEQSNDRMHGRLQRDFARVKRDGDQVLKDVRAKMQQFKPNQFVPYSEGAEGGGGAAAVPPAAPDQKQLQNQLQFNEGIIAERERDMADIHKSVTEVNEIFKDVARIVHEQQEDIDKIEEQVGESHTSAAAGLKEVKQAADMQSTCALQ